MNSKFNHKKITYWGIIGCGKVTEIKSGPAYQQVNGFRLLAVMRRNLDLAKNYAERHGVQKYYNNAESLINDNEIDAIYIATPPDSHLYYALKVAEAGKICCIEKPMATNYRQAVQICNAFDEKNIPLFVAYYRRSLPRFEKIKSWIDEGKIGNIRHINWHLFKPASKIDLSKKYNWRTDPEIAYGGYFDDLASHGLDLFIYILGNIKEATGIAVNQQGLYAAKDAVTGCWTHKTGVTGSGTWNFGSYKQKDKVEIFGSKGKITFSVFENNPVELSSSNENLSIIIDNPVNIQFHHVQNIKEHLAGNLIHPSSGTSGSHTSWVMDKILGRIYV